MPPNLEINVFQVKSVWICLLFGLFGLQGIAERVPNTQIILGSSKNIDKWSKSGLFASFVQETELVIEFVVCQQMGLKKRGCSSLHSAVYWSSRNPFAS